MGSHDNIGDFAAPADQEADLPVQLLGESGDLPRQFMSDNAIRGAFAAVELFDSVKLFRSETGNVSVYLIDG